jgi:hypothetical protein
MFEAFISITGFLLLVVGTVVALYWELRFMVAIYKFSLWWFFGCLFVPFLDWVFVLLHFRICRKQVGLSLLGLLLTALGCWMAKVD